MDEEALRELDTILKPLLERSCRSAKWQSYNGIPSGTAILERFRMELDHSKVTLSNQFYKIDQLINKPINNTTFYKQFGSNEEPKVDTKNYVRETEKGYKVFNGGTWVAMSKKAEIELKIERSSTNFEQPIVRLYAYDPENRNRITYTDNKILSERRAPQLQDRSLHLQNQVDVTWTDPFMSNLKSSAGGIGKTAGTINAYNMMQHYQHGLRNPFNGKVFGGQWRSLDGQWYKLKELESATGFRKGSLSTSHRYAKLRGSKQSLPFKRIGKICFGISVVISGVTIGDALVNNPSNKSDVIVKSGIDITFAIVAFVPGFGWAISGAYFILDANGAFGNWGQSSGFSQTTINEIIARDHFRAQQRLQQMNFDIEYGPSHSVNDQTERHNVQRDKTYVRPRTLFKTFH